MSEPNWISAELHDGLMPWIIGARMQVMALLANAPSETAIGDLPQTGPSPRREQLQQILQLLDQACHEGRLLLRFIDECNDQSSVDVPALLDETCRLLLGQAGGSAPTLEFIPPTVAWPQLPPSKAWHVLRIVQQAFANALFHSHGTLIVIDFSLTANEKQTSPNLLSLTVSDNGQGFDPAQQFPGHYGLGNMRERARAAGLELQINSNPQGGGTRVELRFNPATGSNSP